jgi:hypothetical protein
MMGTMLKNKLAVGIDIGCTTLRAAALCSIGTRHEVVAAAETQRTPNHPCPIQLDVQRLIFGLQRQGLSLNHVILGAPPDNVASAVVELPPRTSGAPIESLADAEISKNVKGPFESALWDLPDAPRQSAAEYLTLAYSHSDAADLVAPFESEGLFIDAIEPEVAALSRVTGGNNRLVLDMGRRGIRMYAYEGKNILFSRNLERSDESDISSRSYSEVVRTIDYLAARFPCLENATVIVLGRPSEYAAIRDEILSEFEADITDTMPIELIPRPWLKSVAFDTQWATAIGLALRPQNGDAA